MRVLLLMMVLVSMVMAGESSPPAPRSTTRIGAAGATLPASCALGQVWSKTGASAGPYWCNESGTWQLMGGSGGATAAYSQSFTAQTSVALTHNLASTDVLVRCYTADATPVLVEPSAIALTDANTVTVTFAVAQSGKCVVR
jgi:hypothetical protein